MWDFKLHEKIVYFLYFDLFDYHYKILKNIVKAMVVATGTSNTCLTRKAADELLPSDELSTFTGSTFISIFVRFSLGIVVGC